jgi:hypothetical protein
MLDAAGIEFKKAPIFHAGPEKTVKRLFSAVRSTENSHVLFNKLTDLVDFIDLALRRYSRA